MITKEMLIPNETVLLQKADNSRYVYLDCSKNNRLKSFKQCKFK